MDSSGPRRLGNHAVLFAWRDSTPHWSLQWSFSVWLCRFLNPKNKLKHHFFVMYVLFWSNPSCLVGTSNLSMLPDHIDLPIWASNLFPAETRSCVATVSFAIHFGLFVAILDSCQKSTANHWAYWDMMGHAANATVQRGSAPDKARSNPKLLYLKHQTEETLRAPFGGTKIAETSDPSSSASLCFTYIMNFWKRRDGHAQKHVF